MYSNVTMYVCMYVCMDGWMDVCMDVCMYVCMHACMHACTSFEIIGMESFHLRTNKYSQFEYGISQASARHSGLLVPALSHWEAI